MVKGKGSKTAIEQAIEVYRKVYDIRGAIKVMLSDDNNADLGFTKADKMLLIGI